MSSSDSSALPGILGGAFQDTAARWPLVVVQLGTKFAVVLLVALGAAPALVPLFRFALELTETGGGAVPSLDDIDPAVVRDLFVGALPWVGLGCLTTILLGSVAALLAYWVRGGTLGELAREGASFSSAAFARAGRRFFWRVFWVNVAFHCVVLTWTTSLVLAALVAGVVGSPNALAEGAGVFEGASPVVVGLLFAAATLAFGAIWGLFRLAEASVVARDERVANAFSTAVGLLLRRAGRVVGAFVTVGAVSLTLTGLALAPQLAPRIVGSSDAPAGTCGASALWIVFSLGAAIVGAVADVWIAAVFVRLVRLDWVGVTPREAVVETGPVAATGVELPGATRAGPEIGALGLTPMSSPESPEKPAAAGGRRGEPATPAAEGGELPVTGRDSGDVVEPMNGEGPGAGPGDPAAEGGSS